MPIDPEPQPGTKKPPRAKPVDDGFVVFEVDGFAQLTPEQKAWPLAPICTSRPPEEEQPPGEK
jgi:hypothetical protein